jgi:Flp pilus assembly protein TadD
MAVVAAAWVFLQPQAKRVAVHTAEVLPAFALAPRVAAVPNEPLIRPAGTPVAMASKTSLPEPVVQAAASAGPVPTSRPETAVALVVHPLREERSSAPTAASVQADVDYLPLKNTEPPARTVPTSAGVAVKTRTRDKSSAGDLARRQIDAGDLAAAEQTIARRLAEAPADREARELQVGLMLRGSRYAEAQQAIDDGLLHRPTHFKLLLIKSRLLAQTGDSIAAIVLLEQLHARNPASSDALQMLGALYQQQQRYADAVDVYRQLVTQMPSAATAWVGLAIGLDGLGDADALESYRQALRLGGLPEAAARYARQRQVALESDSG